VLLSSLPLNELCPWKTNRCMIGTRSCQSSSQQILWRKLSFEDIEITSVRSNHGGEFENEFFKTFFNENDISCNFLCPKTPQHNRVVERKNRTLQEMVMTLNEANV